VSTEPPRPAHVLWGDPTRATPLTAETTALVEAAFGPLERQPVVGLADVRLPEPGLEGHLLDQLRRLVGEEHVRADRQTRIRHTRGRSTPDLLRIRAGDALDAPDAVALPADHDQVAAVVEWCSDLGVALVPHGGGTSVVGGLTARREGFAGLLAVDLCRLDRLLAVDPVSRTATLEAGLRAPRAEELLAEHGLTLGHFPQSFEHATVGGFAATRSSGQASAGYGRFDSLVVALTAATPIGTLRLGAAPASAAGPDLRQLALGSEGAFGVITSVTARVRPRPEARVYEGWRFESFHAGAEAVRRLVQDGEPPTVLRLSDETETALDLGDPGHASGSAGGCLMITGHEGTRRTVDTRRSETSARLRELGGVPLGEAPGAAWERGRFAAPYLRDSLLDTGVLVETLETAAFWADLERVYDAVRAALQTSLADQGTPPVVLCHVSHVYETGASLYFTVAARQTGDPLNQWSRAKAAASDAIVAAGATITHHHAVGRDHLPWLAAEIGHVGVEVLRAVKARLDPAGVMNPGVLIPVDPGSSPR
jgi:alkyldihydroxyacetonephosphate synthase